MRSVESCRHEPKVISRAHPRSQKNSCEAMSVDARNTDQGSLFVTSHWPLAPAYGAQQRVLNIRRLLSRFGDVSFVIVPTEPEDEETVRRTKREFEVRRIIRPLPIAPGRSPRSNFPKGSGTSLIRRTWQLTPMQLASLTVRSCKN